VDQTSGTTPPEAPTQGPNDRPPAETPAAEQPGFGSRGRIRRRARFLRRARELAYRDLGGLVFNLHRFGERNDSLVLTKLSTLSHIDTELRSIERALGDAHPITVLREAGITACPRCAAIHGSEDRFCPNCGLPLSRNVDLPIGGTAPVPAPPAVAGPPAQPPASPPAETPSPAEAPAGSAPTAQPAPAEESPALTQPPFKASAPSGPEDSTEILHPPAPSA
jgi:hypothetical protein